VFLGALRKNYKRTGDKPLWSVIPPIVIVLSQAMQPIIASKSYKWGFNRGQGAQLCEQTQDDCAKLRGLNLEIAKSPCKRIELPEVKLSPTEPG
jgi:hypothetical protein